MKFIDLLHRRIQTCERMLDVCAPREQKWWKHKLEGYNKQLIDHCEYLRTKLKDLYDTQPK